MMRINAALRPASATAERRAALRRRARRDRPAPGAAARRRPRRRSPRPTRGQSSTPPSEHATRRHERATGWRAASATGPAPRARRPVGRRAASSTFGRHIGWSIGEIARGRPRLPGLARGPARGPAVPRRDRRDPADASGFRHGDRAEPDAARGGRFDARSTRRQPGEVDAAPRRGRARSPPRGPARARGPRRGGRRPPGCARAPRATPAPGRRRQPSPGQRQPQVERLGRDQQLDREDPLDVLEDAPRVPRRDRRPSRRGPPGSRSSGSSRPTPDGPAPCSRTRGRRPCTGRSSSRSRCPDDGGEERRQAAVEPRVDAAAPSAAR